MQSIRPYRPGKVNCFERQLATNSRNLSCAIRHRVRRLLRAELPAAIRTFSDPQFPLTRHIFHPVRTGACGSPSTPSPPGTDIRVFFKDGTSKASFLDRLVERAIVLKVTGKSYRAWLAQQVAEAEAAKKDKK
jgi:hypothetical protein